MAFIEFPLAAISFWTAARTLGQRRAPVPAAVPRPKNPRAAGLAARIPLVSRLPLTAGIGAITAICCGWSGAARRTWRRGRSAGGR